jgi:hypothetical protein
MNEYIFQITREVLVQVTIRANSQSEALDKYRDGDIVGEEKVLGSCDVEETTVAINVVSENEECDRA